MLRRLALSALCLSLYAACGADPVETPPPDATILTPSDGGSSQPDATEPLAPVCTKDQAQLTAKATCLSQEHCPCGTRCSLGECVADCTRDQDCAVTERCDEVGTCRARSDLTLDLPRPEPALPLLIEPALLRLESSTAARALSLAAPHGRSGPVRVVAPAGLELACDGTTFEAECRWDEVPTGSRRQVLVRATGDLPEGTPRQLRVYTTSGLDTVTVEQRPRVARALAVRGTYRGVAVATQLGVLGSIAPASEAPSALTLPVTARYYPAEGVLELRDRLGVLHPSGVLIGTLQAGEAHFPAFHLPLERAVAGADPELLVQALTTSVALSGVDRATLTFQLDQRFEGILKPTHLPFVRYRVTLTYEAPLGANDSAPAVPAEEQILAPLERASEPTAWEAGLVDVTPGPSAADYRATHRGERYDVSVCGANEAERLAATRGGATELIGDLANDHRFDYATPADFFARGNVLERALVQSFVPAWVTSHLVAPTSARVTINLSASAGREGAADELPCAVALPARNYTFLGVGGPTCDAERPAPLTAPAEIVDACGAYVAAYDCEVVEPTRVQGERPRLAFYQLAALNRAPVSGTACTFISSEARFEAEITRVCRLRNPTPSCAEAVLCEGDGDATTPSSRLVDARSRKTGDLTCLDGTVPALLELDAAPPELGAASMLKTCIADLDHLAEAPALTGLDSVLDGGGCVGPRLVLALDYALERARRRAWAGDTLAPDVLDALAHRLLQRWLQVHQLLARESLQAENLAAIIRRVDPSDDAVPPGIDRILEKSRRGLSLLFHPRWATALDALPAEILASPDYRRFVETTPLAPNPNHDQPLGLSVGLDELLTAQLALAELRLQRARFLPDPRAVADSGALLREAIVAAALSADLRGRAQGLADRLGERLSWEVRGDAARATLSRAMLGVIDEVDLLTRGQNPLGIEDSDLPLYFLGDEVGAGRKFSAVSDYLLGSNPGAINAWAPSAVRQAQSSLTQAREAWTNFKSRQLQREITAGELDRNIDTLRFEFGDRIANYCSAPDTLATAGILEEWEQHHGRPFSASNCFLRLNDAKCQLDLTAYASLLRSADVGYQLCVARRLQDRTRTRIDFTDPAWSYAMGCTDAPPTLPVRCGDGAMACATCDRGVPVPFDLRLAPQQLAAVSRLQVAPALLDEIRDGCAALYPNASVTLPSLAQVASVDYDQGRCYRGQLGEQALTIRAATKDIEIARAELAEHMEGYDIAMRSCILQQQGDAKKRAAQQTHDRTMLGLNIAKAVADSAAATAGAGKDCATALGNENKVGTTSAFACMGAALEAAATIASVGLQTAMDELERSHAATLTAIEAATSASVCFNDVEQFKVGITADTLRVQRALQDLEVALYQFNEMRIAADTYFADGQAALAVLRDRTIIPPTHDYWLSEAVTTFSRDQRYAKRLTYLAVRAVEFEYQQSLEVRARVLAAELPDELQAILQELSTTAGTRSVGGGRPAELQEVFSVRKDLFGLPTGLPPNTDPFRLRIKDPRQMVISPDGRYLGQLIPFTLGPELVAGNDCAERLWSVSVNIVGRPGVLEGVAPNVRLEVRKKNTFHSRWCSAAGHDEPVQLASVRPTKNLLRAGNTGLGLDRSIDDFTSARVNAWINVEASEFFDPRYGNGSSELAARGLYGEYALFIPAESMSSGGSDGLRLAGIDDILIRFDYVSVARP